MSKDRLSKWKELWTSLFPYFRLMSHVTHKFCVPDKTRKTKPDISFYIKFLLDSILVMFSNVSKGKTSTERDPDLFTFLITMVGQTTRNISFLLPNVWGIVGTTSVESFKSALTHANKTTALSLSLSLFLSFY